VFFLFRWDRWPDDLNGGKRREISSRRWNWQAAPSAAASRIRSAARGRYKQARRNRKASQDFHSAIFRGILWPKRMSGD